MLVEAINSHKMPTKEHWNPWANVVNAREMVPWNDPVKWSREMVPWNGPVKWSREMVPATSLDMKKVMTLIGGNKERGIWCSKGCCRGECKEEPLRPREVKGHPATLTLPGLTGVAGVATTRATSGWEGVKRWHFMFLTLQY